MSAGHLKAPGLSAAGFTLIEVIGALVIFSLGVLGVMQLGVTLSVRMEEAALRSELAVVGQERFGQPGIGGLPQPHPRHDHVLGVDSRRDVYLVSDRERLDSDPPARGGISHPLEWLGAVFQRFHVRGPLLVGRQKAGFTLLEAIVALTLSSVIVTLVSSVFLTQNNFYRSVVQRTRVQDNLRVATDFIASEVRGVAGGGVTTAESRRFVVHLPIAMGGVCHNEVAHGRVYMPGLSDIDGDEVAGYALQDAGGDWTYTADTWSNLLVSSGSSDANQCLITSGADTVGATADFGRLLISGGTTLGEVIMIYRDVEFKIDQSELNPRTLAVYRGVTGDTPREFATGITSDTKFQYRLPSGTYQNSITGASLANIENIRVIASAIATDSVGGIESYSYEWTAGIPLRNKN